MFGFGKKEEKEGLFSIKQEKTKDEPRSFEATFYDSIITVKAEENKVYGCCMESFTTTIPRHQIVDYQVTTDDYCCLLSNTIKDEEGNPKFTCCIWSQLRLITSEKRSVRREINASQCSLTRFGFEDTDIRIRR